MKRDLVSALIRAHYENDERHFKAVALQAAARLAARREALREARELGAVA